MTATRSGRIVGSGGAPPVGPPLGYVVRIAVPVVHRLTVVDLRERGQAQLGGQRGDGVCVGPIQVPPEVGDVAPGQPVLSVAAADPVTSLEGRRRGDRPR
jgi:hypothetical protein